MRSLSVVEKTDAGHPWCGAERFAVGAGTDRVVGVEPIKTLRNVMCELPVSYARGVERVGRKRSEEARAAVLRAMRELVTEQGYSHVTIEKIAARAKVGKPTIYRWWQSKNAILAECVLSGEVLPTPVEPTSPTGRPDDAIEWLRAVLTYIDDNAPLLRGIVAAAFEDPAVAEQLSIHLAYPIEAVFQEWASTPGRGSAGAELSARAVAQLFMGAIVYRLSRSPKDVAAGDDPMNELFAMLISRVSMPDS